MCIDTGPVRGAPLEHRRIPADDASNEESDRVVDDVTDDEDISPSLSNTTRDPAVDGMNSATSYDKDSTSTPCNSPRQGSRKKLLLISVIRAIFNRWLLLASILSIIVGTQIVRKQELCHSPETNEQGRGFCTTHDIGTKLRSSCPETHFLLHKPEAEQDYVLSENALQMIEKLPGPLYIFSELGPMNTGKSLRQTMMARLLFSGQFTDCDIGFSIRDPINDGGYEGKSRGLKFLSIPVNEIVIDALPREIREVFLSSIGQFGTIILLDSEGSDEVGNNEEAVRKLQLFSIVISSAISFSLQSHVTQQGIHLLGYYAMLIDVVETQLNGLSTCTFDEKFSRSIDNDDGSNSKNYISSPRTFLLPKDTQSLLSRLPGVDFDHGPVLYLHPNATLDATHHFWEAVGKQNALGGMNMTFKEIKSRFESVTYLINLLPREVLSSRFGTMITKELEFYRDGSKGLPFAWKCGYNCGYGLTYGYARYILPRILEAPPKVIDGRLANGRALARFMRKIDILGKNDVLAKLLSTHSTEDATEKMCLAIGSDLSLWTPENTRRLRKMLPIDDPECRSTDEVPSSKALFSAWWQDIVKDVHAFLCTAEGILPTNIFEPCFKDDISQINELYDTLYEENAQLRKYKWRVEPYGPCIGDCPGYRDRSIECVNAKGNARNEECCDINTKPNTRESCHIWWYDWFTSGWEDCGVSCTSVQHRKVACIRCDNTFVDDKFCGTGKPIAERVCKPTYEYRYHGCNCPCGSQRSCETIICIRCGSDPVEMDECRAIMGRPHEPYCGRCKSSCFGMNNSVHLANGSTISMAEVKAGDILMASSKRGIVTPQRVVYSSVLSPYITEERDMLCIGVETEAVSSVLTLTASHLVYSLPGTENDLLFDNNGRMLHSGLDDIESVSNKGVVLIPAAQLQPNNTVLLLDPFSNFHRPLNRGFVTTVESCHDVPVDLITNGTGDVIVSFVAANSYTENFPFVQRKAVCMLELYGWLFGQESMNSAFIHYLVHLYDYGHQKLKVLKQFVAA